MSSLSTHQTVQVSLSTAFYVFRCNSKYFQCLCYYSISTKYHSFPIYSSTVSRFDERADTIKLRARDLAAAYLQNDAFIQLCGVAILFTTFQSTNLNSIAEPYKHDES